MVISSSKVAHTQMISLPCGRRVYYMPTVQRLLREDEERGGVLGRMTIKALNKLTPARNKRIQSILVDLEPCEGLWGRSALVQIPEPPSLFAFRQGNIMPVPVVHHPGTPAGKILIVLEQGCLKCEHWLIGCECSSGILSQRYPTSRTINTRTEDGAEMLRASLRFWNRHAYALGCDTLSGIPFPSNWNAILQEWSGIVS